MPILPYQPGKKARKRPSHVPPTNERLVSTDPTTNHSVKEIYEKVERPKKQKYKNDKTALTSKQPCCPH
jgi:hypothetical protein